MKCKCTLFLCWVVKCRDDSEPNAQKKTRTQEIDRQKIDDAHENSLLNCELDWQSRS